MTVSIFMTARSSNLCLYKYGLFCFRLLSLAWFFAWMFNYCPQECERQWLTSADGSVATTMIEGLFNRSQSQPTCMQLQGHVLFGNWHKIYSSLVKKNYNLTNSMAMSRFKPHFVIQQQHRKYKTVLSQTYITI